ncbi:MAG: FMN-binding protein [Chitinivibrionales bacterium]|nr:FMN-binding protein [Chitinivibrionales bacterium]
MKKSSPAYILLFIVAISAIFGFGVSMVHYSTEDLLERNLALHRNRTIARAFDLDVTGDSPQDYLQTVERNVEDTTMVINNRKWEIFFAKDGEGEVGFIFSGMGFWDRITGILVLSSGLQTIKDIKFLSQKETPGLGARIEEQSFTKQFEDLPVDWDTPQERYIIIGPGNGANSVDAITGATQTSLALMKMLNNELHLFRNAYKEIAKAQRSR